MASKKPAASTAVVAYDEELAAAAAAQMKQARRVSMSSSINTAGGLLQYNGAPIQDNTLDMVVLTAIAANVYYEGVFDASNPAPPTCYAFNFDEDELCPTDEVEERQDAISQPPTTGCAKCWANQWNSADTGRGKACKNSVKLALVPSDAVETAAALDESEVITLNVPVTSVKGWVNHQRDVSQRYALPTWGVHTNVSVTPNPKGGFMLMFGTAEAGKVALDAELMAAMKRKIAVGEEAVQQAYQARSDDDAKQPTIAPPKSRKAAAPAGVSSKKPGGAPVAAKKARKF